MSAYRTSAAPKRLPARCAIRFEELPHASQERLRELSAVERLATKRERHTRVYAILVTAAGCFVLIGAVLWSQAARGPYGALSFDRHTPWSADEITTVTGAGFLVGVLLLGGIASLMRQRNAPLGTFWWVHPAYLFDCAHDRVVAYPLALLDDADVVGETVQVSFGDLDLQIAFDFPTDAVRFLVPLKQHAAAAAACVARAAADEIPGADFIPDALLFREKSRLPWDRAWALPLFAGIALSLAGRVVLPGLHASVAERRLVRDCQESPEICPEYPVLYPNGARVNDVDDAYYLWTSRDKGYARYRAAFPAGRHLAEATAAAIDTGNEALERYRKGEAAAKQAGDPRLIGAIASTLRVLRDTRSTALTLRFSGEIDQDLSHWYRVPDALRTNAEAIRDPEIYGLSPAAGVAARAGLRSALLAAAGPGAIDVQEIERQAPSDGVAAELAVTYRIFKGPGTYRHEVGSKGEYQEIDIDWTLTFRWPGEAGMGEVSLTLHTTPAPTFRSYGGSPELVYMNMMADDASNLGAALRQALGLTAPAATAPER